MWDLEKEFTKARYLKAKTYALELEGSIQATTAGSNLNIKSLDDFYIGATFKTKKKFRDLKRIFKKLEYEISIPLLYQLPYLLSTPKTTTYQLIIY